MEAYEAISMGPPDPNGDLEHVRGKHSDVPEGICGFELEPEETSSDEPTEVFVRVDATACCWRETWKNGRCVWHAEE